MLYIDNAEFKDVQIMKKDREKYLSEDSSIKVISKIEELEVIRGFWEKMQWHPDADIDFYLDFIDSHQGFVRPHVILLSKDGQPSALMIGQIQEMPLDWRIGYKIVCKTPARSLEIPYGGILGDLSYPNCIALVKKLMNCLAQGEADVVFLNHLKCDSPMYRISTKMPSFLCRDHFSFKNPHWRLSLPDSFNEFYQQRSKSSRSNIRNNANRMKKIYEENLSIRCFQEKGEIDQAIRDIETIAAKTYQRGLGVGFINSPETRRKWILAAEHQRYRVYVLYLEEKPCAFLTGYPYDRIFFADTTGYDFDYRYYHPGMFLFMRIIEEFCNEQNIEAIDFGFGDAEYKKQYSNQNWQESCVYIFAPTFKGVRLNAIRTLMVVTSQIAKTALNRFEALGWIKKKWRCHLTPK